MNQLQLLHLRSFSLEMCWLLGTDLQYWRDCGSSRRYVPASLLRAGYNNPSCRVVTRVRTVP